MSLPREWRTQDEVQEQFKIEKVDGGVGTTISELGGSLFSIHSAPVCDSSLEANVPTQRPSSLLLPTPVVRLDPGQLSPSDTMDDDDNLLTVSSLTARPLIAKSREIRALKKKSIRDTANDQCPDGGYGWVIVFGAFLVQFWVAGLVKSYGVFFVEIMETYSDSSASVASWIPAILSALCLALAPVSSILCQRFSCRTVVFVGGLFCALGLTTSYFATSLLHLFFTFGVLTGIGGGLSTTPGIVMVAQYFDKHRALANGICVSGTAAGGFVFPLLIEKLCDTFGFHGTILLLGGCMLHVCVSATLYRPLKLKRTTTEVPLTGEEQKKPELIFINEKSGKLDISIRHAGLQGIFNYQKSLNSGGDSDSEEKDQMGETIFMKSIQSVRSCSILHSVEDLSTDSTCVYKSRPREPISRSAYFINPISIKEDLLTDAIEPRKVKNGKGSACTRYLDLSLLKDTNFILMSLSVVLMSTGSPYMLYYLPAYCISTGYSKADAGYLVAISATLDLIGRLGLGWLSDLHIFNRKKSYIISIVGAGAAVLVLPICNSFYVLAFVVGIYGFCLGCWFLLVPVLLADQYGTDRISSSYGLVRMFQSIGAISVPPLTGYMRDITGGYQYCFYCMGTCMVLGGVPLLLTTDPIIVDTDSGSGKTLSTTTASE